MIIIDRKDARPLYEQVAERFKDLILSGGLAPDSKLPSVRQLAIELAINANTIQKAYSELEREGYIYSVKGLGSFVRQDDSLIIKRRNQALKRLENEAAACLDLAVPYEEAAARVADVYKLNPSDLLEREMRKTQVLQK